MSVDPLAMMRAARPKIDPESMRAAQQSIPTPDGPRGVDDLATTPASPGYRSKMPPPPCFKCGEDHQPNKRYDHPWMQEPHIISADPRVHQEMDRIRQEGALEHGNQPYVNAEVVEVPSVPVAPSFRVAVYVGRGDDMYVVSAEQAPDWDTIRSFKVEAKNVLPMVNLVRALGIKVQDKTGGDLVQLAEID